MGRLSPEARYGIGGKRGIAGWMAGKCSKSTRVLAGFRRPLRQWRFRS